MHTKSNQKVIRKYIFYLEGHLGHYETWKCPLPSHHSGRKGLSHTGFFGCLELQGSSPVEVAHLWVWIQQASKVIKVKFMSEFRRNNEIIVKHLLCLRKTKLKGMTFDHNFGYSFTLFSFLLKKEGRRKGEWIAKILIKSHAFQPGFWETDRAERHCFFTTTLVIHSSFSSSLFFLGGKRKRENNNQSRGQKSCLSARS